MDMNKYNFDKIHKEAEKTLKKMPKLKYSPHVSPIELIEIGKVMEKLPELEYPISSAAELIEKLGGRNKRFELEGVTIIPHVFVKRMPAYYFPIFSKENFIEKMAEVLRQNRKKTNDLPKQIKDLKQKLPKLDYPIQDGDQLVSKIGDKAIHSEIMHRDVTAREMVKHIPDYYFPMVSEDDFYLKIGMLMTTRPLVTKD